MISRSGTLVSRLSSCLTMFNAELLRTAEPFWPAMAQYGNIMNLRVFWIDHIYTIEPEHIKASGDLARVQHQ